MTIARNRLLRQLLGNAVSSFREEKENEDTVLGGSRPVVLCELTARMQLHNLYPYRIARSPFSGETGSQYAAVWFRPLHGNTETEKIGLVEEDEDGKYCVVQLVEGREVIFLPSAEEVPQALIVSQNGGSIALWQRKGTSGALKSPWQETVGMSCRPILGMEEDSSTYQANFVECRQVNLIRFQGQVSLLVVGSKSNGLYCLIAGPQSTEEGLIWNSLLPNIKDDPVLWLNEREQVTLVVPLPHEGSIRGGYGIATTHRVLILSWDLKVLAEVENAPPPSSLVPLGSFTVAYCSHSDYKLRYLSGVPESFGREGIIASFPLPVHSYCPHWLVGIRPDRFLYNPYHNGTRLVERGQSSNSFLLPFAVTRPALLLEPMIANAIATGGSQVASQPFLRTVVEKFGRKLATMSHGEDEGIGNFGAGISPRVFELLEYYNLKAAASWLLTGTINFDRNANSRLMPSWIPVSAKIKGAVDTDTHLHIVSNGDQYLTEYLKSPDNNMSSTLPRPSDPTSILCNEFAIDAIKSGNFADAVKMLDLAGTESTDARILQLSMAMQADSSKDATAIIQSLFQDSPIGNGSGSSTVESLAALAIELKKNGPISNDFIRRWMQPLAPSFQRGRQAGRQRSRIIGESVLSRFGSSEPLRDNLFSREFPESKLVWNEGPNREKDKLLMLDNIQEWFGRCRPVILGKEGAKSAEDRGASTLADILNANDDDSFGGENDDDFKDGWVDGVGEGLKGMISSVLIVLLVA